MRNLGVTTGQMQITIIRYDERRDISSIIALSLCFFVEKATFTMHAFPRVQRVACLLLLNRTLLSRGVMHATVKARANIADHLGEIKNALG